MSKRFYCQPLPALASDVILPSEIVHHLTVRRIKVGETIELFDGLGSVLCAHISDINKRQISATTADNYLIDELSHPNVTPLSITLAQCISGSDNMDWTIEKAVELGVDAIQPLQGMRSIAKIDGARVLKKMQHWQAIVQSACAQSGRAKLPKLHDWQNSLNWLQTDGLVNHYDAAIILHPRDSKPFNTLSLPTVHPAPRPHRILVCIGPEAGFSEQELSYAKAANFQFTTLGPRILRTETAGLAFIAALQGKFGDF
jgi:16S rRNA (uracil1498-N3)-methyltransferase